MTSVGTASVEIVGDVSKFASQVNRDVKAALAGLDVKPVSVAADLTVFRREVDSAKTSVSELSSSAEKDLAAVAATSKVTGGVIARSFESGAAAARGAMAALATSVRTSLLAALGPLGAVLGIGAIIGKGFQRLTSIEDAKAKLEAFGNTADSVAVIMQNALAAVKGTAFGLGDAATIAASAVAAGVKPGKDLERVLKLTADAASAAGTDLLSMGAIFNKVKASGKLFNDTINQLSDRGIPIIANLAKTLKVPQEAVFDLAKAGAISFNDFINAMAQTGDVAQKLGKTTTGSFQNVGAAVGRFGAALLSPIFPSFAGILQKITAAIDLLGESLPKLVAGKEFDFLKAAGAQLGETIGTLAEIFKTLFRAVEPILIALGAAVWVTFKGAVNGIKEVLDFLNPAFEALNDFLGKNKDAVTALIGLYVAYQIKVGIAAAVTYGLATAQTVAAATTSAWETAILFLMITSDTFLITQTLSAIGTYAVAAAQGIAAIASTVWAGAVWLLNAALAVLTAPITLIILGVALLVVGVILAYQHFKVFRDVVKNVFDALKNAAKAVWDFLVMAFTNIGNAIVNLKNAFVNGFNAIVDFFKKLPGRILGALGDLGSLLFNAGKNIVQGLIDGLNSMLNNVKNAAKNVVNAIKDFLPFSPAKMGPFAGSGSPMASGMRIGEMLAEGLGNSIPAVAAASRQVTGAISGQLGGGGFGSPLLGGSPPMTGGGFGGSSVMFSPGAVSVSFNGVVPTEMEAQRTGEAVGMGIAAALQRRDMRVQIRAV